ncbi:MAG: radical SAM protein, partial [Rubrobacteridae bacterium]|nr:radical SAM protein [Rubrobacteridae bacterium]
PFQHASRDILRAMNRSGTGDDYLALLAWLRREIPDVVIRSTAIVGFPGETEDDFIELIEFAKQAKIDYLGVFEYSEEDGTKAAELKDKVPSNIIRERYHELVSLQDSISQELYEKRIGKKYNALLTHDADVGYYLYEARAWWQAPEVDGVIYATGNAADNQIVNVLLEDFDGCDFHGVIEE